MSTPLSLLRTMEFMVTTTGLVLRGLGQSTADAGFPALDTRAGMAGGALGTLLAMNRSARTSLNRNRNRNRTRTNEISLIDNGLALEPWRERSRLYALEAGWANLPLQLPPDVEQLRAEATELLRKQIKLRSPQEALRREEIIKESRLELSAYLRPFGIEDSSGYEATIALVYLVCLLCDEIGLRYKHRFNTPRPNLLEPRLRPFLPIPPHSSYPSNHALQSFAVAFVLSRVIPEHPASSEIFLRARRVAENREWAGLHYASDTQAGHDLARMLMPVLEVACRDHMLAAQKEWI